MEVKVRLKGKEKGFRDFSIRWIGGGVEVKLEFSVYRRSERSYIISDDEEEEFYKEGRIEVNVYKITVEGWNTEAHLERVEEVAEAIREAFETGYEWRGKWGEWKLFFDYIETFMPDRKEVLNVVNKALKKETVEV